MATQWQKSCIEALALGPEEFLLFKLKQKNKRLLNQFLNRIWPYKYVDVKQIKSILIPEEYRSLKIPSNNCLDIENPQDNQNFEEYISKLFIWSRESGIDYHDFDLSSSKITIKNVAELEEIFVYNTNVYDYPRVHQNSQNHLCSIRIYHNDSGFARYIRSNYEVSLLGITEIDSAYFDIDIYRNMTILKSLCLLAREFSTYQRNQIEKKLFSFYIGRIHICGGASSFRKRIEILAIELSTFKYIEKNGEKQKSKKIPKKKLSMCNIGIEIEHLSNNDVPTDSAIEDKILRNNCVSYDSGHDGDSVGRLRENRIRLDGIKGLKGLYILLEDMKKTTTLTQNSSVHMHIDGEFDNSYAKLSYNQSRETYNTLLFYPEALTQILKIFELDPREWNANKFYSYDYIKLHSDFHTVEYRFCIVNLNYSIYVIEILALIHLNECLKHKCKTNTRYLTLLADVKESLTK